MLPIHVPSFFPHTILFQIDEQPNVIQSARLVLEDSGTIIVKLDELTVSLAQEVKTWASSFCFNRLPNGCAYPFLGAGTNSEVHLCYGPFLTPTSIVNLLDSLKTRFNDKALNVMTSKEVFDQSLKATLMHYQLLEGDYAPSIATMRLLARAIIALEYGNARALNQVSGELLSVLPDEKVFRIAPGFDFDTSTEGYKYAQLSSIRSTLCEMLASDTLPNSTHHKARAIAASLNFFSQQLTIDRYRQNAAFFSLLSQLKALYKIVIAEGTKNNNLEQLLEQWSRTFFSLIQNIVDAVLPETDPAYKKTFPAFLKIQHLALVCLSSTASLKQRKIATLQTKLSHFLLDSEKRLLLPLLQALDQIPDSIPSTLILQKLGYRFEVSYEPANLKIWVAGADTAVLDALLNTMRSEFIPVTSIQKDRGSLILHFKKLCPSVLTHTFIILNQTFSQPFPTEAEYLSLEAFALLEYAADKKLPIKTSNIHAVLQDVLSHNLASAASRPLHLQNFWASKEKHTIFLSRLRKVLQYTRKYRPLEHPQMPLPSMFQSLPAMMVAFDSIMSTLKIAGMYQADGAWAAIRIRYSSLSQALAEQRNFFGLVYEFIEAIYNFTEKLPMPEALQGKLSAPQLESFRTAATTVIQNLSTICSDASTLPLGQTIDAQKLYLLRVPPALPTALDDANTNPLPVSDLFSNMSDVPDIPTELIALVAGMSEAQFQAEVASLLPLNASQEFTPQASQTVEKRLTAQAQAPAQHTSKRRRAQMPPLS